MLDVYDDIRSTRYKESEILLDIMRLHNGGAAFELDCCYSTGQFYASGIVPQPRFKFDLNPQVEGCYFARAEALPFEDCSISSMIFDPPFLAGNTTGSMSGKIVKRFTAFPKVSDLWAWYNLCLVEHYRILKKGGVLAVKCQDVVSQRAQFFSHCYILNAANAAGFYAKDLFVLLSKNRIRGTWKIQSHARKYHCYYWVFTKQKIGVVNHLLNLQP